MKKITTTILLAVILTFTWTLSSFAFQADIIQVCFSPRGGCTENIVDQINAAKSEILVQAYSFTSAPIAYSGAIRHLIPFESATRFHFIPPPDSSGFRHGNPAIRHPQRRYKQSWINRQKPLEPSVKIREVAVAAERLSMRTIKEVLRLKWEKKFSNKQVAQSCNIARSTVRDYVERAQRAGLSWPLAPDLDDGRLEALLFSSTLVESSEKWVLPDMEYIRKELTRKSVTLRLLWLNTGRPTQTGINTVSFVLLSPVAP